MSVSRSGTVIDVHLCKLRLLSMLLIDVINMTDDGCLKVISHLSPLNFRTGCSNTPNKGTILIFLHVTPFQRLGLQ